VSQNADDDRVFDSLNSIASQPLGVRQAWFTEVVDAYNLSRQTADLDPDGRLAQHGDPDRLHHAYSVSLETS
jgi:hypothetical protein